jgi:hypothetical protein
MVQKIIGGSNMSEYDKFEHPCDDCKHRLKAFCRAYGFEIKVLNVQNCKRRKMTYE